MRLLIFLLRKSILSHAFFKKPLLSYLSGVFIYFSSLSLCFFICFSNDFIDFFISFIDLSHRFLIAHPLFGHIILAQNITYSSNQVYSTVSVNKSL